MMGVEKQINSLENFFRHVNYPLQPLHYETKIVLDTFFEKGGFLNLCDMIFGEYSNRNRINEKEELTWMDIGNSQPNGKVASAIFRLLAPGGHFCNLLEAVSLPQKDFSKRLKDSWKGDTNTEPEFKSQFPFFDIPISSLYSSYYEILSEPSDKNWYTFSRSRCPSMFFIPFWHPPLVTRFEPDHGQVLTSLPCSPISYFIIRMLLYVTNRAEKNGINMVRKENLNTSNKKIKFLIKNLLKYVRITPSEELPLYHRILTAYIQYFVSTTFVERLNSKRSLEEVNWITSDVTASLLLSAPSLLWMKGIRQTELEIHRIPCRDIVSAALVFKLIPFLTECFLALHRNNREKPYSNNSKQFLNFRKEFFMDSLAFSAWDILYPDLSFYRNILIALRQSLISLDNFRDCKREHFNNTLELWYTLIKPNIGIEEVNETYVIHHYEIYSFLLMDVFSMILKSNFLFFIDFTGATMLERCFEVFSMETVQNVFREVSNTGVYSRSNIIDTISQYFTLNWTGENSSLHILKLFGEETLETVAEVYLAIDFRIEKGDLEPNIYIPLKHCLELFIKIFNGLLPFIEKRRNIRSSITRYSQNVNNSLNNSKEKASLNTEEEKQLFLKGLRRSCGFIGPLGLRFSTENNCIPGSHHPFLEASFGNEFPYLVFVTNFIDMIFKKLLEFYYSSWIPKCSRGHMMWLLSLNKFSCINHPQESAIWECSICEEVYGACCRSNPYGKKGEILQKLENFSYTSNFYCSECYSIFEPNTVIYNSLDSAMTFCSDCASRPFKKRSCRFLASYMTWAIIFLFIFLSTIILNV